MTLEESAEKFFAEPKKWDYTLLDVFKGGYLAALNDRSCCCGGCTKHNLALTNTESNGEFRDE